MLSDVFRVLRNALINHIRLVSGFQPTEPVQEQVVFASADRVENIDFKLGALTMMLVNLEEDRKVLPPDPYRRLLADGTTLLVKPPVPLNVCVLFVARFNDYLDSLRHLDFVVQFFQRYRVIEKTMMPALVGTSIEKLVCELVTIPTPENNHVWGQLNTAYQPSLLYRIRMVVFHDADGVPAAAASGPPSIALSGSSVAPPVAVPAAPGPSRWAYYCVTDLTDAANALHIVDTAPVTEGPALVFLDEARRSLDTVPDPSDVIGLHLVRRNPGKQVVRFVSSEPVAVRDEPRRFIELRLGDDVLSTPLANPSATSLLRIDLSLTSDSSNPCDALIHIIEYYTQPTQTSN